MSLIYRAIWRDDRHDLSESAPATFERWARSKHGDGLDFDPILSMSGGVGASRNEAEVDGVHSVESTLVEEAGSDRWMTRQRVLATPAEQWIWVDVERTTDEVFRRQDIAAPRLVRDHIRAGIAARGLPRVGSILLDSTAHAVRPERVESDLVRAIKDPARTLPIVVFSHREQLQPSETMERATKTQ